MWPTASVKPRHRTEDWEECHQHHEEQDHISFESIVEIRARTLNGIYLAKKELQKTFIEAPRTQAARSHRRGRDKLPLKQSMFLLAE